MTSSGSIVIVSPFPDRAIYMDGWMSRIKTIDLLFSGFRRTYVDFQTWYPQDAEPEIVESNALVTALRVNPNSDQHRGIVASIFEEARFVYIHTLHQCEYMLKYYDPDKMLIDIHGVVPEEELMMGSAERSEYFGRIEAEILSIAKRFSVVTKSMGRHYQNKYNFIDGKEIIHLPVMDYGSMGRSFSEIEAAIDRRNSFEKPRAIYAGGAQIWQCVDEMMHAMSQMQNRVVPEIYSHNVPEFTQLVSHYGLSKEVFGGNIPKAALTDIYNRITFGFSIREDSVVNRVASPTKLCDYCSNLVVPIIKFPDIGDFSSYGYAYLTLDEFIRGYLPDKSTLEWMIMENIRCMTVMREEFILGLRRVLELAA